MLSSFELTSFTVGSFTAKLLSWVASRVLDAAVSFRFAGFQRVKDVSIHFRKVKLISQTFVLIEIIGLLMLEVYKQKM